MIPEIVNDGEDALKAFESYRPNLILLDLMLPGIDGYQVCREIRAKNPTSRSSCSRPRARSSTKCLGLELGADDYIMKPFDSKELVARVKAVLRRYPARETGRSRRGYQVCGISGSGHQPVQLFRALSGTSPSTCRQRNSNFCISLPPLRTRCSQGNSFSTTSGAMNTSETRVPWMSMSNVSEKRSRINASWSLATVWGIGYKFEVKD